MFQAGDSIGRYVLKSHLGRGGMGMLWRAYDPKLDRRVALKFFLGDVELPGARERFQREAQATAGLGHNNIVHVYDFGDWQSQPYIVMEYIHGQTLDALIRGQAPVPITSKLRWMEELCAAVGYAHTAGVIHRDIKPANLMIDASGHLKVLDFGIARMRGTLVSNATAQVGTPGYCAPEQFKGGEIDHRSDLFSVGVVAYELLAYREAFSGDTPIVIASRIQAEEPPSLLEVCPDIDPELVTIVERALRKAAADRYPNAGDMQAAIAAVRARIELDTDRTTIWYVPPLSSPRDATPPPVAVDGATIVRPQGRRSSAPLDTPDRRQQRETQARERARSVKDYLRIARERLTGREFLAARHACEQARRLDATHPEVRELDEALNRACEADAQALVEQARDAIEARSIDELQRVLAELDALYPGHPHAEAISRELQALKGTSGGRRTTGSIAAAPEAGRQAPAPMPTPLTSRPPTGGTVVVPPRPSAGGRRTGASTAHRVAAGTDGYPPANRSVRRTPPFSPTGRWLALTRTQRYAAIATPIIVVLAVLATAWPRLRPTPPLPPASRVVIDAVPWAEVQSLVNDRRESIPLPGDRHTPLALQLPAGNYVVRLRGPKSEQQELHVTVEANVPGRAVHRFTPMTTSEYFAPLLGPAVPDVEGSLSEGEGP